MIRNMVYNRIQNVIKKAMNGMKILKTRYPAKDGPTRKFMWVKTYSAGSKRR